jgi:hypothetical protein
VIRTLAVAAAITGAIMLAPVAQAQPPGSTGPGHCNSVVKGAARSCGPNMVVPTTLATPFGATIARQPGLATALANGNIVLPTGTPFGFATPMAQGNMVAPATTITPLGGGIRTRRGFGGIASTAGTSPLGTLGGLLR